MAEKERPVSATYNVYGNVEIEPKELKSGKLGDRHISRIVVESESVIEIKGSRFREFYLRVLTPEPKTEIKRETRKRKSD